MANWVNLDDRGLGPRCPMAYTSVALKQDNLVTISNCNSQNKPHPDHGLGGWLPREKTKTKKCLNCELEQTYAMETVNSFELLPENSDIQSGRKN